MVRADPTKATAKRAAATAGQPLHETSRQDNEGSASLLGLTAMAGLGERLAARAVAAFGSVAAFEAAVRAGDVERIAAVPGIGPRRARRLVHAEHGEDPEAFFGTPQVATLFAAVRDQIAARAGTRAARNRILLLAPTADPARRAELLQAALRGAARAATTDAMAARALLARLAPVPPMSPAFEADVLLLADSSVDHEALRAAGLHRWAPIADLEDPMVTERIQATACVLHLTRGADAPDGAPVIPIPFTTDAQLAAPWGTVARFERARDSLEAMRDLAALTAVPSVAPEVLRLLDRVRGSQPAVRRSSGDMEAIATRLLEEELAAAEARLENLTLTGRDLVRALAMGENGLPQAVAAEYDQAARRAAKRLEVELGFAIDAYTDTTPPRVDAAAVRGAAHVAADEAALRRVGAEVDAARRLETLAPRLEEELAAHVALDWELAVGGYVLEHSLVAPEWGEGLLVDGLLPLAVGADAERVDYRVALNEAGRPDDVRATLLTGANSGGKSTLLEALALLVAMAHAGLPVPARRAIVPEFEAVHLYRARGERGAGALEALLLELFPLAQAAGRRLVLADELEAMTELTAAAEILASLLESLTERDHLAVLATHLAPHLMPALSDATKTRVRVDGIEASGLDAEGRLVVSRSPRLGVLARSTPELILRRLALTGRADLRATFAQLAERVAGSRRKQEGESRRKD